MESFDENGESNKFHMISDAGGNVVNVLHSKDDETLGIANSYEYGPFGQVISKEENVENPYQFNPKYTDDETGLVYYGFRYYDAKNGRWLNQDPIGVNGGINVYNSVSNNMVNGFSGWVGFVSNMDLIVGELGYLDQVDAWGLERLNLTYDFAKLGKAESKAALPKGTKWVKKFAEMLADIKKEVDKHSPKGEDPCNCVEDLTISSHSGRKGNATFGDVTFVPYNSIKQIHSHPIKLCED